MKKHTLLLISCISICLVLAGCGGKQPDASGQELPEVTEKPAEMTAAATAAQAADVQEVPVEAKIPESEAASLQDPVMEWWELYNPNGFDTVTAKITNPNNVAVDTYYDLVFYKDGQEVGRLESCANNTIRPGESQLVWANYDVPRSSDVDDVRMENVETCETLYPAIGGTAEYKGIIDGEFCCDFKLDSKPTLATFEFLLYNDQNGNGKFDKGEIVVTEFLTSMEQEGRVSGDIVDYPTDCEIYFFAY